MDKLWNKKENQILLMLAFFSISIGLWGNFRQLWLQSNGYSVTEISNIISIGTFISVIGIFLTAKYIKLDKLKKFMIFVLFIKFFNLIFLCLLNNQGLNNYVSFSIVIDFIAEYIIITSIYPLITNIIKTDTIFSKRRLTEYLFRDIGILIGGIIIGKIILGKMIDYNMCLIVSNFFLLMSLIVICKLKIEISHEEETIKEKRGFLKYIISKKIIVLYLIYLFVGTIAMSTALGLKMLTLTGYYNFSDTCATNYFLIVGLIADIIGIIALKYLTPKNDYLTITIKFGIRFLGYIIAFLSNDIIITLIAITWSLLISTAYENICEGKYINLINKEYQLSFTSIRNVIRFLAESIGIFLCGIMYEKGLKYMLGLSSIFMIFQIGLAYYMVYLRTKKI